MTDAALHHDTHTTAARNGKTRGGGHAARFPNRFTVNVDDELLGAIQLAASIEKEPEGAIVRRWLRSVARGLQLLPNGDTTNGR